MNLLALTVAFPLLGFMLLSFARGRMNESVAAVIGVGSIGLSAITAAWAGVNFLQSAVVGESSTTVLWRWMSVDSFSPQVALYLDGLSLTMLGVITGVGFLIHMFASWYMRGEEGYARFFAYMNLFVASMLMLVLGNNLLVLYLGWEGVGLCSYLLIGFYFRDGANGRAAMKAFIVTRVGDTFMAIGLFVLYRTFGTLDIQTILHEAPQHWEVGAAGATLAALLLLGGAVGKSAQLPLHTWLPDAMAGPTPVSALIHAATMVTAGVYLIARMHTVFELAPDVLQLVGIIGCITLLLAGFTALVQTDIKRILAYSTMSQIGYMFMALGAGAWHAAIFHLMTHAFFKALLFLSAGAVILACHHEQDIFRMGGLRKRLPFVYACFLIGGSALAALPVVTAGFYSKDEILWDAFLTHHDGFLVAGLIGAFLTSLYTFRLIFTVFHGEEKIVAHAGNGIAYRLPLVVLMLLSTFVGGVMIHPPLVGVLPELSTDSMGDAKVHVELLSGLIAVAGIGLAAILFLGRRRIVDAVVKNPVGNLLRQLWLHAWGFDWFYDRLFVYPFNALVNLLRRDMIDRAVNVLPSAALWSHDVLALSQNGRLRWYAVTIAFGAVLILAVLAVA